MDNQLHANIISRLERDFEFKHRGEWLQQGICPNCGKKEVYTRSESPWILRCNRINQCGYEEHVKERYSDLFNAWSARYPIIDSNPHATADAYLKESRGFDLAIIKGWYTQENYYNPELKIGSATVRFSLPDNGFWERIIDDPQRFGKRKANFRGQYGGQWWAPPNINWENAKELWLTEGIFDAIALLHHNITAVATLSTNNYPAKALAVLKEALDKQRKPRLVFAFDSDKAGSQAAKKYVARARDEGWQAVAAQIPPHEQYKRDWNDLHLLNKLSSQDLTLYRHHGDVLTAPSAAEKAYLLSSFHQWHSFPFDYEHRYYWFKLDMAKLSKAQDEVDEESPGKSPEAKRALAIQKAGCLTEIANCLPSPLYYQANTLTDESWYYFRVDFPHGKSSIKNTFTGGQLASASEFKKRLLSIAPGAVWTGSAQQLDRLLSRWTYGIKTVQTIDYIGYSKEYGCYVWGDLAIQQGRVSTLNDEDFFDLNKLSIKTLSQSVKLHLSVSDTLNTEWLNALWLCFGAKGIVALAFWLGSLFAEQIRETQKSLPFLEIVGEAGAGKSTLIEFLWKLLGRADYEGFDPAKATNAARARNFSQVSNLPVVLIESDREFADHAQGRSVKNFDWDELKTAYNGRSIRSRGMRNNGNETYEPPFRGAVVISQNATVSASDAIMQRICHLHFERSGHTEASKQAAGILENTPLDQLSSFLVKACQSEQKILALLQKNTPSHEATLLGLPSVRHFRIAKNHAQLLSMVDALATLVPLTPEQINATYQQIHTMAGERQQTINADHPLVQEFWEIFEFLDGEGESNEGKPILNHSRDSSLIAINLNHFLEVATDHKQKLPPLADLKRVLKTSRMHKFIDIRAVNSAINAHHNAQFSNKKPSTLKCWIFQA